MRTVRDICKYIGSVVEVGPVCIETGSTFAITPENLIHTTTNNIVEYIVIPKQGTLLSLDIDEERTRIASSILPKDHLDKVHFVVGDSVENLKGVEGLIGELDLLVSVLCLDSSGDPEHMLNEYNSIKGSLAEKHFVLVDDIHNPSSIKYKKVVPLLKELGYSYIEVPTPVGMFMASKGYPIPQV